MSLFITFEGPEGSGKSTQARLLYEQLYARRYPVILVREPGGTRIGDLIRRIVLDLQHTEMAPTTETLLFSAARAQLVSEVIRPYLEQGGIVLCDRYADSTFAYQGYGLGRDMQELQAITRAATGGLRPDMTVYLDLSAEEGLERKWRKRQETRPRGAAPRPPRELPPAGREPQVEWNRLDARELAYHQRVEAGYRALIAQDPGRWYIFDARQPIEALAAQIFAAVEPRLRHIEMLEAAP
ncbi:MAG TPA: dTMP kinase [Roseiflexaceae bacterium]|nr:dTMP kinase [Roseiflexaceae bacterium]